MPEENFDIELDSVKAYLEGKIKAEVEKATKDLEKRMLVRTLGQQYCRLCHGAVNLNPPPSDIEALWHEGNHGNALPPDRSRGLPGLPSALDWNAWENATKERRRK
jgi:hypothetical protein